MRTPWRCLYHHLLIATPWSTSAATMPGQRPASTRSRPFQKDYELKYGVKPIGKDLGTHAVISARCQPCVYFGKEEQVGSKRQRQQTKNIKTWTAPFRPELFVNHHCGQHPEKWEQYVSLSSHEKKAFFEKKTLFVNTIHAYLGPPEKEIRFKIRRAIVNIIIGEMFFAPSEVGGASHARALALFKPELGEVSDPATDYYIATIKNCTQFELVVHHLAHGLSFRQVAAVIEGTKRIFGVHKIGAISESTVTNFARVIVATNLQSLHVLLESADVLAFSLAFDSSTHRGVSYLALRARFHYKNRLVNLHILAVPMFERHTEKFNLSVKIFDALSPSWRSKLIGIGSDGANVMTGRFNGVVTRLQNACRFHVHRSWCLLHQVDLVAKAKLQVLFSGEFMSLANKISTHLRRQGTLIREMGNIKCPKMTTRWLAMGNWAKWQLSHIDDLQKFFGTRTRTQIEIPVWNWPVVAAVFALFDHVNITITTLQDRNLIMSQQQVELERLISVIKSTADVCGPLQPEHEHSGPFSVLYDDVVGFSKTRDYLSPTW